MKIFQMKIAAFSLKSRMYFGSKFVTFLLKRSYVSTEHDLAWQLKSGIVSAKSGSVRAKEWQRFMAPDSGSSLVLFAWMSRGQERIRPEKGPTFKILVLPKQVPRGYIRCDYFIVTRYIIVCDVHWWDFTFKNGRIRRSKISQDRRTDGRTRPLTEMRSRI